MPRRGHFSSQKRSGAFSDKRAFHSSSLDSSSSSSSSAAAFLAGFFFFFLFLLFEPVDFDSGFSKICRISSSVILWSDFKLPKSRAGGAANLVMPFLVIAIEFVSQSFAGSQCV